MFGNQSYLTGRTPCTIICLQARFSALVVANTRRTAALCAAPGALALFALELLRDQAESALRLVKAYDESSLGLAEVRVIHMLTVLFLLAAY